VVNSMSLDSKAAGGVLIIGDIQKVFSDAEAAAVLPCRICGNILDGIEAASSGGFSVAAVVLGEREQDFRAALGAIRQSCDAQVILLCEMWAEPRAMQLVAGQANRHAPADDYLICPLTTDEFCIAVAGKRQTAKVEVGASGVADAATEARTKRLEKLATEDDLTGLKNRRYIWEFGRQIIERAKKNGGGVTLLVFDIDDFKHYNDAYGHAAGDEILRQAAVMIRRCCRRHDVVGRIGGDEFAVVFWDDPKCGVRGGASERRRSSAEHPREVIFIAKRFRRELGNAELHLLGPAGKGVLTISGGLASLNRDGQTIEQLFAEADAALLEAKRSGKNRIYLVGQPQNDIDKIE